MGRGNYNSTYRTGKRACMPVARDTAFGLQEVSDGEMAKNWEKIFKNTTPLKQLNKKHECTCNMREEITEEGHFLVEDECKFCNSPGKKVQIKMTDIEKKFSKRHMQKVQKFVIYGGNDIREITDRNA